MRSAPARMAIDELRQDTTLALRQLRRSPGFALVAVVTLALGIGANAAVFTVADSVLLRPLPFHEPDALFVVRQQRSGGEGPSVETTYPEYREWRDNARSLAGLAAVPSSLRPLVWTDGEAAEPVATALASGNLFDVLGARASLGRTLAPDDDRPGAAPGVMLAHGLWARRYGGDRSVLGRQVRIAGKSHTVVGVMPRGFEYPRGADAWIPLVPAIDTLVDNRQIGFLDVIGRVPRGRGLDAARQELDQLLVRTSAAAGFPPHARHTTALTPVAEALLGSTRRALLVLLAAAALVLVVACVNVANLLLARGAAREPEIAVRSALGAGRARLARQFMIEAAVVGTVGAVAGLALFVASRGLLVSVVPADLYRADTIAANGRVPAFTLLVAAVTVGLFGVLPALRASRALPADLLRAGAVRTTAGAAGKRQQGMLVATEVALAVALLAAGGVLLRSFSRLDAAPLGFDRRHALTAEVFLPEEKYGDPARARAFWREAVARAEAIPGVTAAGAVLLRPLEGPDGFDYPLSLEGQSAEVQRRQPLVNYQAVTPGYFAAVGIPLVGGRTFAAGDDARAPRVVVVSDATAARMWPNESAIGKRLKWGPPDSPAPWAEVVGVVGAARYRTPEAVTLDAYVPFTQSPWMLNHLVVRSAGDPALLAAPLQAALRDVDRDARLVRAATIAELTAAALQRPRFQTMLVGAFAVLALVLGGVGIYGVVSFATATRRRELGVRIALGARARHLYALVVGDTLRTVGVGVVCGLGLAVAGGRVLRSLVYEVSPTDPTVLALVALLVLVVAAAAALVPAWGAGRVDPVTVMRAD